MATPRTSSNCVQNSLGAAQLDRAGSPEPLAVPTGFPSPTSTPVPAPSVPTSTPVHAPQRFGQVYTRRAAAAPPPDRRFGQVYSRRPH